MSISVGTSDDGLFAVAALTGQADVGGAGRLLELLELCEAGRYGGIIVDLSRVVSMDWWAALILLWLGRVAEGRGLVLLLAGAHASVRQVLEEAGAADVAPCAAASRPPSSSSVPYADSAGRVLGTRFLPTF